MVKKCAILVLLMAVVPALSDPQLSKEESTVRRTYAKTAFAVELNRLFKEASSVGSSEMPRGKDELRLTLSDFKVGNVSDLRDKKYGDLVSKPAGREALMVTPVRQDQRENDETVTTDMAEAKWRTEQTVQENWDIPVIDAIRMAERNTSSQLSRYASYSVTLTYQGQTRNYRAMFLFGVDAQGNAFVFPIDTVVNINGGAVEYFASHAIVPDVFVKSKLKNSAVVREWLTRHSSFSCMSAAGDVCCDLTTLECGIGGQR